MGKITLTDRERQILRLSAWSGITPDWKDLYLLSREKIYKSVPASISQIVSNWKNSYIIKDYYNTEKAAYLRYLDQIRAEAVEAFRAEEESQTERGKQGNRETGPKTKNSRKNANGDKIINFQDRNEFLQYLEKRANEITDEKLKFDYIKQIAELQQYKKDADESGAKEIQRFYTPLQCQNCQLYKFRKDKTNAEPVK